MNFSLFCRVVLFSQHFLYTTRGFFVVTVYPFKMSKNLRIGISVPEADCQLAHLPLPRSGTDLVPLMLGGRLFVFGGEENVGGVMHGFVHPLLLDRDLGGWREYTETAQSVRTYPAVSRSKFSEPINIPINHDFYHKH